MSLLIFCFLYTFLDVGTDGYRGSFFGVVREAAWVSMNCSMPQDVNTQRNEGAGVSTSCAYTYPKTLQVPSPSGFIVSKWTADGCQAKLGPIYYNVFEDILPSDQTLYLGSLAWLETFSIES